MKDVILVHLISAYLLAETIFCCFGLFAMTAFEVSHESEMHAVSCQDASWQSLSSRHKRSKSCPHKELNQDDLGTSLQGLHHWNLDMDYKVIKKKQSPTTEVQSSLKREILQLERHLQDQFALRRVLEKSLGHGSCSHDISNETSMPKTAKELIKEISVLELEVVYLEQHLLSLYRKAFDQQTSSISLPTTHEKIRSASEVKARLFSEVGGFDILSQRGSPGVQSSKVLLPQMRLISSAKESSAVGGIKKLIKPTIQRNHSSPSQCLACSTRTSTQIKNRVRTSNGCHSQPLPLMENEENSTSDLISLAELIGARISDHVPVTPNRLSEDVIRCIGAIYCKLAEPPPLHHSITFTPSSLSTMSTFSPRDQCEMWSPHCKKESTFDLRLENSFQAESSQEFSGPYSSMVEVRQISRDRQKLNDVEDMLQNYSSLVQQLEKVDPTKMKHEEKLAFWINIHNALVMHAYFENGIPHAIKRGTLLSKATYNVGGQTITADIIQNSILRCRMIRPGQWFLMFFSPRMKFKAANYRQSYAIEKPEPLLHFALCAGSQSDPAVRVYTAKRVFQELEAAKEDYIQLNISIHKEQRILLPKIIESFAKDSNLSPMDVVDMIQQNYLPKTPYNANRLSHRSKCRKIIEWTPHNFSFRYLLPKDFMK